MRQLLQVPMAGFARGVLPSRCLTLTVSAERAVALRLFIAAAPVPRAELSGIGDGYVPRVIRHLHLGYISQHPEGADIIPSFSDEETEGRTGH